MNSWYHFEVKNISRYEGGNLAKTLSYDLNRKLRHNGLIVDKTKDRGGEKIYVETNIPGKYFANVQEFIDKVERAEKRIDARVAKRIIHSLPSDLEVSEHKDILEKFHKLLNNEYDILSFSVIHDVNEINTHAHTTLTTRSFDEATGLFGKKNRDLDRKKFIEYCRKTWADCLNEVLDEKGRERITHKSYSELGINKEPKRKLSLRNGTLCKIGVEKNKKIDDRRAKIYKICKEIEEANAEIRKIRWGTTKSNNSKWNASQHDMQERLKSIENADGPKKSKSVNEVKNFKAEKGKTKKQRQKNNAVESAPSASPSKLRRRRI